MANPGSPAAAGNCHALTNRRHAPPRQSRRADTRMHARLKPRTSSPNTPPARPVRGRPCKPTVSPTVLAARIPSAIRPWTPPHAGPQRYKMAHHETKKKRPA